MTRTILGIVLFLIAAMANAQEKKSDLPLLTVTGSGQSRVAPDEATVRFGINVQAATARAAQENANGVIQKALTSLTGLKIPRADIQTAQLTLSPIYSPQRPGDPRPPAVVAYSAQSTLSVRVEDLTLIGKVIDAGIAAGANTLEGVQFGLKNDLQARLDALKAAVVEARQKADAMSQALAVRLVSLQDADEGVQRFYPQQQMMRGAMAMEGAGAATPVEPGQVVVSANVTLRYVIADRK